MRTLLSSMKQYIANDGNPVQYVTWMSKPQNGVELDDAESGLIDKIIPDVLETLRDFTVILDYKLRKDPSHKPFECSYRLTQKRGEDIDVGNIEPIE